MATNKNHMNVLKKVLDAGCSSNKEITDLTAEDMITFCKTITEVADVLELQKAVKENKLISYLCADSKEAKNE